MADLTLKALLFGEDRSMSKTFEKAGKKAESSAKGIRGHLGGMSKALEGDLSGLTSSITGGIGMMGPYGAAAAAGIGAVSAVALPIAKESIDAFKDVAGETLSLQRIMGGTAEDASRMRFAFHETGVDAQGGAKAIGIFSKNLVASEGSSKKTAEMVKKLGFDFRDAHGNIRPMSEMLPELAEKFHKMPNGAEKTALALQLFGKSGAQLLPFLNRGKEGIQDLTKESDKFGLTLSGKDLDALKKSRVAHKEWDAAMEGAKVRIGAQLLPMVTKLVTWFTTKMIPVIVQAGQWFQKHGDTIQQVASVIGKVVLVLAMAWVNNMRMIGFAIKTAGAIFQWLWTDVGAPVTRFLLNGFASVVSGFAKVLHALGHVPGFGWAEAAARKMDGAAAAARGIANSINAIPSTKSVTVQVSATAMTGRLNVGGQKVNIGMYASGGTNLPRGWKIVGEQGPELMWTPGGDTVLNATQTAQALAGGGTSAGSGSVGGGSERPLVVQMMLDGRVVHQTLLKVKRERGGVNLGLA